MAVIQIYESKTKVIGDIERMDELKVTIIHRTIQIVDDGSDHFAIR